MSRDAGSGDDALARKQMYSEIEEIKAARMARLRALLTGVRETVVCAFLAERSRCSGAEVRRRQQGIRRTRVRRRQAPRTGDLVSQALDRSHQQESPEAIIVTLRSGAH